MRTLLEFLPIRWLGLIVWGTFVILMTTLPGWFPIVFIPANIIGRTSVMSTIGHGVLFGILTLLMWHTLNQWYESPIALGISMLVTLSLGTSTETFQWFVSTRNASIDDLLANYLGVFVIGFGVSYIQNLNQLAQKIFPLSHYKP